MKNIHPNIAVRLVAATLVAVAVIAFSTLAAHISVQNENGLALKNIRTDKVTTFYADRAPNCAWFVEAVYADQRPTCAWFVEAVLPANDSKVMTENLKSVAATL